jgi:methyl halide transferase
MVIPTSYPPLGEVSNADARAELRRHFGEFQDNDYGKGWAKLWETSSFLPWDRGMPSPALIDTLVNYREVVGGAVFDGRRKKALVPGCGRGVDVLLLASFGYDAVGLEISPGAVKACEEFADANEGSYPVKDEEVGKGSRRFVLGDFYNNEWKKEVGMEADEPFDLIYDYTVSDTSPVRAVN